jgi:putative nucleotidyltransferase with HDIG domain
MSTGGQKRSRQERVARLELPPTRIERLASQLSKPSSLMRIGLCVAAAVALVALVEAWQPQFWYRVGYTPSYDVFARVSFQEPGLRDPADVTTYREGQLLAKAGVPLLPEDVRLLRMEHEAWLTTLTRMQMVARTLAALGLILALFALCGFYVVHREPRLLRSANRFASVLFLVVACVGLTRWLSQDPWRAELVPPLALGFTIAVAYSNELALLVTAGVCLVTVLGTGREFDSLVVILGTLAVGLLFLGRIRSRSKLIKIGFTAGLAAALLTLGVGVMDEQPLAKPLVSLAARNGIWSIATAFLITGLLPFIEKRFGVLTDISLLEIGDVRHPLLQELVRRAPGTYNHSINVASLAEHAAEAIGANSLLVRVGAYFHDIGKMFKPGYFIENQQDQVNRHDSLVPTMSTLIIIAHVKDGADLARQHHLPEPIIDFIEQHHGTTLVEYFYHRASEKSDGNGEPVPEASYRYPGPKPQTKEAGVLMLADAAEGACRVLVEPNPARIRDLAHEIVMKRLHDGQFDECGLNLCELRTIEDSLVKSLTAVYHGRLKYPSQRTA